jgi:hypothetical protein
MPTFIVDLGGIPQARLEAAALASARTREASWRLWCACQRIDRHLEQLTLANNDSPLEPELIDRFEDLAEAICALPTHPNAT